MKFGFIFLFLLPFYSFAFLGLGDADFCEKNPGDLLCSEIGNNLLGDVLDVQRQTSDLPDGEI